MKVFTSQGIEKEDNADVLVELKTISTTIRSAILHQHQVIEELKIANLQWGILNDQVIEGIQ